MPFDATPRDEPERRGPKPEHDFSDHRREVCANCGITGEALLAYPETPCDPVAARAAMDGVDAVHARLRFRRGPF